MENNYVDILEFLLNKKKKDPSKLERDEFCAAWVKLACCDGFTDRTEQYLYNGVSYCGAKPFKVYLDQCENKERELQEFFTGKMYGHNTETTFRLLVHLLALLLNDKSAAALSSMIIMRLPHACFNKDKKRLGNIETILLKYFFAELNPNTQLVPLAEIGVKKPVFIEEFVSVLETAMNNIDPSGLSKNKIANMAKVRQWIDAYRQSKTGKEALSDASSGKKNHHGPKGTPEKEVASEEPASAAPKVPTETSAAEVPPVQAEETAKSMSSSADSEHPADMMAYLMVLLDKAGKVASVVKSESTQQKTKIDVLNNAIESEQRKLSHANQRIVELQTTVSELQKNLSAAESEIFALRKTVEQGEVTIAERDAEISERIKMADVLCRDRSKQADETLQRLASKIKVEYRDFADALDVPMSCDLGENLRLQLQSVFDILEKGGMKIK